MKSVLVRLCACALGVAARADDDPHGTFLLLREGAARLFAARSARGRFLPFRRVCGKLPPHLPPAGAGRKEMHP